MHLLRAFLIVVATSAAAFAAESALVHVAADGAVDALPYNAAGDRLPDFSHAGYGGGGVQLPDVPGVLRLEPAPGDNHSRLQNALDEIARREPDASGWRGALVLAPGRYEVGDTLVIRASGIVLRGAGHDSANGTVLVATKPVRHDLIQVGVSAAWTELPDTMTPIVNDHVPVGATKVRVAEAGRFVVGDRVLVRRHSTAAWIATNGMDRIPPRPDGGSIEQWQPGAMDLRFDRTVRAVDGDVLTFDAPLTEPIHRALDGGSVTRYTFPERIHRVGIEHLLLESAYDPAVRAAQFAGPIPLGEMAIDENHGWNGVSLLAVEDAWVRGVTSVHFGMGCVSIDRPARRVTVTDSACLDPVAQVTGGRRYAFYIGGQLALVRNCRAVRSRHAFSLNSRTPGPNVFLDCVAEENYSTSESHHRWASGTLWDNVTVDGPFAWLMAVNRGWMGTGHGWSGAQMVFWNCSAPLIAVQHPPTAQNFAVGYRAGHERPAMIADALREVKQASGQHTPDRAPFWGDGYTESPDAPVEPASLYRAQLLSRLPREAPRAPVTFLVPADHFIATRASLAEATDNELAGDLRIAAESLRAHAEARLTVGPWSVMDKRDDLTGPRGDKHDYVSLSSYWWPNADGVYEWRDGQINPDLVSSDESAMAELISAVTTLAQAGYLLSDDRYLERAALLVRHWFLDPATRMNPNLDFAAGIPGQFSGRCFGLHRLKSMPWLVDAFGLLATSPAWSAEDERGLREWMRHYLDWALNSEFGREERDQPNNHAVYYGAQILALALYLDDREAIAAYEQDYFVNHLLPQIAADGSQPAELIRTRPYNYTIYALTGYCLYAELARHLGHDLYHQRGAKGQSLADAFAFVIPFLRGDVASPKPEEAMRLDRMFVNARIAATRCELPFYETYLHTAFPDWRKDPRNLLWPSQR